MRARYCGMLAVLAAVAMAVAAAPMRDAATTPKVAVRVAGTAYTLEVGGKPFLESAETNVTVGGKTYSTLDGSLVAAGTATEAGMDEGGEFTRTTMAWKAGAADWVTSFRVYPHHVVFQQVFADALNGTASGSRDSVLSSFPSFKLGSGDPSFEPRGYLSFQGDMCGSNAHTGQFDNSSSGIGHGVSGSGPVVIFTQDMQVSVTLSAFSNFMSSSQDLVGGTLAYGVMGSVTSVPKGYLVETVASISTGVNRAMEDWGDLLLTRYRKDRYAYKRDYAMQYLGYSTDNGAYYYQTEPKKNYEDTLIDVKTYADSVKIPYKYVLLDSWWYYKGHGDGVTQWDARPDVFPHGLEYLYNVTGWPTQLHNRFWAIDTVYAKQNGGKYDFLIGEKVALPNEERFWDDLFLAKRKTGMFMYEQDWLDVEFDQFEGFQTSATLGRDWMLMMGSAANRQGQTFQACMSHVRHILQGVEMFAMTNARASGDYHPGNGQWYLGTSSILAHAVGIAPSKDNYWSTPVQEGTHYGPKTIEPNNRLQAAIITFTTGPVAPSDMVGGSDPALILKSCTAGGRLLQPHRPMTEIDAVFAAQAGFAGPKGHVMHTHSHLDGLEFAYVLAVELGADYSVSLADIGYGDLTAKLKAFESNVTTTKATVAVDSSTPLSLKACDKLDFQLYTLAPQLINGWTLLGELNKWVSVSEARFSTLSVDAKVMAVVGTGTVGETVSTSWLSPTGTIVTTACVIPNSGSIRFVLEVASATGACFHM